MDWREPLSVTFWPHCDEERSPLLLKPLQLDDDLTKLLITVHSPVGIDARFESMEDRVDDWLEGVLLKTVVHIAVSFFQ